jgi:acyl-CoA thioesterase FadM
MGIYPYFVTLQVADNKKDSTMLKTHYAPVPESYCDYNGHLNEGYYLVMLSLATDTVLDAAGLDAESRNALSFSAFTVQNNLRYFKEIYKGKRLTAYSRVLSSDKKRLRIWHELRNEEGTETYAAVECLLVGVDMASRKSAVWPAKVETIIRELQASHEQYTWPMGAGNAITQPAQGASV